MPKQKLMDELMKRYEDSAFSGKSAKASGVTYNVKNKSFCLAFKGAESQELPATFVTAHKLGGKAYCDNLKKWIKG